MEPHEFSHEIDQGRVNARAIEPCAIASWPARETMRIDGWLLRFTDGYSQRANSVATHRFEGAALGAAIAAAEREYRARNLPPLFQITPVSAPAELETALRARGYALLSPTHVMRAPVAAVRGAAPLQRHVEFVEPGHPAFERLVISGSHSAADGAERLFLLSRITLPHGRALVFDGDEPVACGVCALMNGLGGIYLMRTDAAHRRRSHAQSVLKALAEWAVAQGAEQLYLQVDEANTAARALYARAGFSDAYSYRFWRTPAQNGA